MEDDRNQQRLHRNAVGVERGLELFVDDALVRGMHVDDDQAVPVLRQDVDAGQLGQREAQRRYVVAGGDD